jgi:hypothetical protein
MLPLQKRFKELQIFPQEEVDELIGCQTDDKQANHQILINRNTAGVYDSQGLICCVEVKNSK